MRWTVRLLWGASLWCWAVAAHAWTDHAWSTWLALQALPSARDEALVRVEPLEKFLLDQGPALEAALQYEEQWARGKIRNYPARPEVLAYRFDRTLDPAELKRRFLMAVRVNPGLPLALNVQVFGPAPHAPSAPWASRRLQGLREGDWVSAVDVIATAAQEPDEGMDTGLWLDSGTEHGKLYGFGRRPFANWPLPLGEQAAFHMGFFHEPMLTYASNNDAQRMYPEYRMHLWQSLARFALVNGHAYWGWRFAGWAMHYAQDMTQPYHASLLPGTSLPKRLWMDALGWVGSSDALRERLHQRTMRQRAFERYQAYTLASGWRKAGADHPDLVPLTQIKRDAGRMALPEKGLRDVVALQASQSAAELDARMEEVMAGAGRDAAEPAWLSDDQALSAWHEQLHSPASPSVQALDELLREIAQRFGSVTRAIWRRLQ